VIVVAITRRPRASVLAFVCALADLTGQSHVAQAWLVELVAHEASRTHSPSEAT
jgi:hypothetical protein